MWFVPPLKYRIFPALQEVPLAGAAPSHPWTSRGWALSWEEDELGGRGVGTPGPGGGVFVQSRLVLTHRFRGLSPGEGLRLSQ